MKQTHDTPQSDPSPVYPAYWSTDELVEKWIDLLHSILNEEKSCIPVKRAQRQVERESLYQEIMLRWPNMDPDERLAGWKNLIGLSESAIRNVLPACVACGECCRQGSPTLHVEDLELLQEGKIPWKELYTLRKGEPVRSPFHGELLLLSEERIKIREKSGSTECSFYNNVSERCMIYAHRPLQCRAQACWDPKPATELTKTPYLTRTEIFNGVDLLLHLIEEHDRRCSFEKLHGAFERLRETRGNSVEEVLQLLSYEDHFRSFLGKQLNIPEENERLVFGRSFSEMVPIFGFKVIVGTDGTRCLVPEQNEPE